jgi:hypothetical protein
MRANDVAYRAHIGGFITGLALALVVRPGQGDAFSAASRGETSLHWGAHEGTPKCQRRSFSMMYMIRSVTGIDGDPEIELAIPKDAQHIAKYEAQGFVSCSYKVFREAWRARDTHTFERLRAAALGQSSRPIETRGIYAVPV